MRNPARLLALFLSVGLLVAITTGVALADGPAVAKLQLLLPQQAAVRGQTQLQARATDASGAGVPGVDVVFSESASFLNTSGNVELGRAVTDTNGIAALTYEPTTEGDVGISALVPGGKVKATGTLKTVTGPAIYTSERPVVTIPGVGMWTFFLVIGAVWGMFLWAMVQLRGIHSQGRQAASLPEVQMAGTRSVNSFEAALVPGLAFVVVLGISATLGIIVARPFAFVSPTQLSLSNMSSVNASRSETSFLGASRPVGWQHSQVSSPNGSLGQSAFISYGCASCHGAQGLGSKFAPLQVSSTDQVMTMVRMGPGGMPVYPKEYLPDNLVSSIAQWLMSQQANSPVPSTPTPAPSLTSKPTPSAVEAQPKPLAQPGLSTPTYDTDVQPIFQRGCLACHGAAAMGGLNLSTYSATLTTGAHASLILPGNHEESLLYLTLTGQAPTIPLMPMGSKLDQKDIDTIAAWIDQGAAEH